MNPMAIDDSREEYWREMQARQSRGRDTLDRAPLNDAGGGGTSGTMEERVTRLETHMEYVRRDLDGIKAAQEKISDSQQRILEKLNLLPTKADLNQWRWQWVAIAIAIIALTVGGITGGLALIASAN